MGRKKRTVALVLGSGGARGLAHIGIIEELLNRGYEITSVSVRPWGRWSEAYTPPENSRISNIG